MNQTPDLRYGYAGITHYKPTGLISNPIPGSRVEPNVPKGDNY